MSFDLLHHADCDSKFVDEAKVADSPDDSFQFPIYHMNHSFNDAVFNHEGSNRQQINQILRYNKK